MLKDDLESFTGMVEYENSIINFIIGKKINQERFLSTAMVEESAERYAKRIFWHIKVPAGAKGALYIKEIMKIGQVDSKQTISTEYFAKII